MTTATTTRELLNLAPSGLVRPPRRPRYRPEMAPSCPHCGRLGPSRYSVHVGGLCVRLVADHPELAEVVGGVTMRPVEIVVNGEVRWLWTRTDVSAMDADDLVVMFEAFEPPPTKAKRRVVDGGSARRPEPVALFVPEPTPPPKSTPVPPLSTPVATATGIVPTIGPTW